MSNCFVVFLENLRLQKDILKLTDLYHVGKELSRTERKFESSQLEEEQKSKAFELTLGQMKTDISNLGKKYFYYVHTSQTTSQTIVLKNLICNELCPLGFDVLCPYIYGDISPYMYRLWGFQVRDTKLERFLAKNEL